MSDSDSIESGKFEVKMEDEEDETQFSNQPIAMVANQSSATFTPVSRIKGYECIREGCGNMVYRLGGGEDYFMCSTRCKLVVFPDSTSRLIRNLQNEVAFKKAKLDSLKESSATQLENLKKENASEIENLKKTSAAEIENLKKTSAAEIENLKKISAAEIENLKKANSVMEDTLNKNKAQMATLQELHKSSTITSFGALPVPHQYKQQPIFDTLLPLFQIQSTSKPNQPKPE